MNADIEPQPHESPSVGTRRIVALVLGFVGFATLLSGGLAIYYRRIVGGEKLVTTLQDFPAPRLQPNPARDWSNFHAAQVRALESYDWVDRSKGLVHVPIERAMALVIARGTQAYDPADGTPPFRASGDAPLDGAPRAAPQPSVAPYGDVR